MIMTRRYLRAAILIQAVVLLVTPFLGSPLYGAENQSADALIASMQERLPELMALKLAGEVGENNRALVEARGPLDAAANRLIAAENRDRMAHYALLAERLNLPVGAIQTKRAEQIRERSPSGVWLQSPDGAWSKE
jgi:uncharacterized protein YdbL (DUF1318 family)